MLLILASAPAQGEEATRAIANDAMPAGKEGAVCLLLEAQGSLGMLTPGARINSDQEDETTHLLDLGVELMKAVQERQTSITIKGVLHNAELHWTAT